MSLSVKAMHRWSGFQVLSREHILRRPRNPMSPRIAMSVPGESRLREYSGEDISV